MKACATGIKGSQAANERFFVEHDHIPSEKDFERRRSHFSKVF
jgi:hypothetical protein